MADSNIGALPLASTIADDSLLVMEQQGTAMKVTGQQLKEYAKQGVEMEFQDYLDEAKKAADSAAGAVSAVTDMTVSAHDSDEPTVTKSTRGGKVNLDFGLPRGKQGVPGPVGATGPRGPQGSPGNGLTILGHYETEAELRAAVPDPKVGDPYSVGAELPYDIYIFDGVTLDWINYGPLSGDGAQLPDNLVTCEGGAIIELEGDFGDAPHTIPIKAGPTAAADVEYQDDETVKDALDELFTSVGDGKSLVASAITDKGVQTAQDATFAQMAENIGQIQTGSDTSDATATPGDILGGKTAYTKSGKVEGVIPSLPAQTITPGTADKTIANGQYLAGTQTIKGDPNLTSSNIKKGVSLFGVAGALETSFAAVLTVTADIGAVVTATCGAASVEALSTTGTVVMELPIEGTWKVTAVRGMAQYNTVTLEVSNHYNAALTASLHVQWVMTATPLSVARDGLSATSVGDYAIFLGGPPSTDTSIATIANIDAYNKDLVRSTPATPTNPISERVYARYDLAAATVGNHALFAGGIAFFNETTFSGWMATSEVVPFDSSLVYEGRKTLSSRRQKLAASTIGGYALFAGGILSDDSVSSTVDAFNASLTRSAPTALAQARYNLAAASNDNYIIFGGGQTGGSDYASTDAVEAYASNLTRSIAPSLGGKRHSLSAAVAGNYVLFAGGKLSSLSNAVEAYDLFLTRTTAEPLGAARYDMAGTTVRGFAVFGGGKTSATATSKYVDVYDPYLVRTVPKALSAVRGDLAAATVENYALFGGGKNSVATSSAVDVYQYT